MRGILQKKLTYWAKDFYNLGFYHILSVNVLLKLFGFASQLFVAWWLTTEEIGQFSIMQSFLMYVVLLGGLGFNTSTLKLCSERRSFGEKIRIHKKALQYSLILSFGSVAIFILLNYFGLLVQNISFRTPFALLLLSAIPMVLNGVDTSYLQALKEFKKLAKVNFIARLVSLFLIFTFTFFWGLYGLIIANVLGNFIINLMQYRIVLKVNSAHEEQSDIQFKIINTFKLHINYSLVSFFANLVNLANVYFDMLFINYLFKDNLFDVGRYAFVMLIVSFFIMISDSVRQVLIPIFSENSYDYNSWIAVFNKYKKILSAAYTIVAFIGVLVIPYLVEIVYGNKFGTINLLLYLLIGSWLLNAMTSFFSSAIFGTGELKTNLYCGLIILPISIALKYFAILNLEILGAAISTLIVSTFSVFVYFMAFKIVARRKFGAL